MKDATPFLRILSRSTGLAVWRADRSGRVTVVASSDVSRRFSWLDGKQWLSAIHPDDVARVREALSAAQANGGQLDLNVRLEGGRDGHAWARIRGSQVDDPASPGEWVGVIGDVHSEVVAERALRRSEIAYRALAEASASMVWRAAPDGGMVEARGWNHFSGYQTADWLSGLHADDQARVAKEWAAIHAEGEGGEMEFRLRSWNGEARWCTARAVPVRSAAHDIVEWVGTVVDVHDQRISQAALQRSQQLISTGRLTAGVAHDFNNLLTVITGGAEALLASLAPDDPRRAHAELSLHAAERGADLVRQLLAFSRQQTLNPTTVDVTATLRSVAGLVRRTLGEDIDLNLLEPAQEAFCRADPAQLESALLNLCINARDAMPGGGVVTIEASRVSFGLEAAEHAGVQPGAYVMIAVRDNGVGMSPETLRQAVEPFFTTKASGEGSGLGLSMVYGFVNQSKGHFSIFSEEGLGTQVRIYLPASPAPGQTAVEEQAGLPLRTAHILLVEDNELVRTQVRQQLEALGHKVSTAENGPAALEALTRLDRIDLLMTDVLMPGGMNGRQLADHIRLTHPDLPILFTSGHHEDVILREGKLDAISTFLPKPYRRAQLAAAVAAALGRLSRADVL